MPLLSRSVAALATSAFALALAVPVATAAPAAPEPVSKVIVLLQPKVASDPASVASSQLSAYGSRPTTVFRQAVKGYATSLTAAQATALRADPQVQGVYPDQIMHATGSDKGAPWGLDRLDQRKRPLNGSYDYRTTGRGVTAYVIDTGIRTTHVDFGGRAKLGIDTIPGGRGIDCNGHGTHVAGTIGGTRYGVAKAATLVAVRVLDCDGSGATSGIISAIDWVIGHHSSGRPAVANMSLGGAANTPLDNAIQAMVNDGVSVSVAAGNEGQNACNVSPARTPSAITVGASTDRDVAASFSNWGRCVDLYAPGQDVRSSSSESNTATAVHSGTSMASPHVAGAAARYLESNPTATPRQVEAAVKANATKGIVSGGNNLLYVAP